MVTFKQNKIKREGSDKRYKKKKTAKRKECKTKCKKGKMHNKHAKY